MPLTISGDGGVTGLNTITSNVVEFSGNVSVAGTVTYEDITNVDSVGIITARSGVRINTGGIVVTTGVSTFTSGPVLIGSGTSTGTASQPLQVTGGAYVSGNLGIGTINPQERVHFYSPTSTNFIRLDNGSSATSYYGLNSSGDTEVNVATNNNLIFKTFGTERARLDTSGNFGLGLTNPSSRLHVVASTGAAVIEQSGSTSWVMRHKTINSYNNATAATLFTASPSSNCGLYVEVVVRGSNAVGNQAYKDTLYAFRYQVGGTLQNSNVTSASVTNIVGTHNAGTLAWVNVSSSTPSLTYTQGNNGYILESLDVYVVARDGASISFNTSTVSYG
jgi:hypothetical protein